MAYSLSIEQVEVVSLTDVRSLEIGYRGNDKNRVSEEALMVTSDLNIIDVQLSVQYDVLSARNFLLKMPVPTVTVKTS